MATVALASIATTIIAPILLLALRSAALLAVSSEFRDFRASFGSSWEIWPFFLSFYWQFQCLSLPTQPAYSPLSLSSSDAVYEQCQSAYYGCY